MTRLRSFAPPVAASAILLTACGGHGGSNAAGTGGGGAGGGGSGGGETTATSFTSITHPALPQVKSFGGPVLKSPEVQPIAYASDTGLKDVEAMLNELGSTSYWSDTTSEYGVGALTILPTITLISTPPAKTDTATLEQTLVANTSGANPVWGPADGGTIYLFLIPAGTVVSDSTGTSCVDYDGYHSEVMSGSVSVPYAVSTACHGYDGAGVTDVQQRTISISHELIESATDPFPNTDTAYGQEDAADIVWTLVTGGEVADMCELNDDAFIIPEGGTYTMQRSWSNKAAKAGTNPCVPPKTPDPYFNSVPQLPDTIKIAGGGGVIDTPGVTIPVGATKTIDITLFSDAPTSGPWKVVPYDGNALLTGSNPNLELSLDKDTGQNGDTLHLTIKVLKADPTFGVESFVLYSTLDFQENLWMGVVGQ